MFERVPQNTPMQLSYILMIKYYCLYDSEKPIFCTETVLLSLIVTPIKRVMRIFLFVSLNFITKSTIAFAI